MRQSELDHEFVELICGNARLHMGHEHVEGLGRKLTRLSHALEGLGPMQLDP